MQRRQLKALRQILDGTSVAWSSSIGPVIQIVQTLSVVTDGGVPRSTSACLCFCDASTVVSMQIRLAPRSASTRKTIPATRDTLPPVRLASEADPARICPARCFRMLKQPTAIHKIAVALRTESDLLLFNRVTSFTGDSFKRHHSRRQDSPDRNHRFNTAHERQHAESVRNQYFIHDS